MSLSYHTVGIHMGQILSFRPQILQGIFACV